MTKEKTKLKIFTYNPPKHMYTLKQYRLFLRILGAYIPDSDASTSSKWLQTIYCTIVVTFFQILLVVSMWIDGYQVVKAVDFDGIAHNLSLTFNFTLCVFKILNLSYQRKNIIEMINLTRDLSKRFATNQAKLNLLQKNEKDIRLVTVVFISLATFTYFSCVINRIVDKEDSLKFFPFRGYRPTFIPEYILSPYHVFILAWSVWCIVVSDAFLMVFMNQIILQLLVLKQGLNEMRHENDVMEKLKIHVAHHQFIIKFRNLFEKTYTYMLLTQFITSMLQFGVVGFQAAVQKDYSRQQMSINCYCACIFLQLYLFCYYANQIFELSKSIGSTAYGCLWYLQNKLFGLNLQIFMVNSQKPMELTAGGFFIISLQSFTGVLTKSYSYVALLRQVYDDSLSN